MPLTVAARAQGLLMPQQTGRARFEIDVHQAIATETYIFATSSCWATPCKGSTAPRKQRYHWEPRFQPRYATRNIPHSNYYTLLLTPWVTANSNINYISQLQTSPQPLTLPTNTVSKSLVSSETQSNVAVGPDKIEKTNKQKNQQQQSYIFPIHVVKEQSFLL